MSKNYVAVIQAGGRGTRMRELTKDLIPKPMLILNGKPMIQWQMENMVQYGIHEFIFIIGYLGEKIKEYFGDGHRFGVNIRYIEESQPLGSAGSLYYLKGMIQENDFFLLYADVMFCLDWNRMIDFHERHRGKATLLVHPNAHPFDSDLLIMDEEEHVTGIDSKLNFRTYWYENCVNAGLYILSKDILSELSVPERLDLEKDILSPMMTENQVYGYRTPEYVKDAGTPERFYKVAKEQTAGVWEDKCLNRKQKCVFLDRDGTLNQFKGLLYKEEELELEKNAADAIKLLNEAGVLAIVITNQPVVARGLCSIEEVNQIHRKMQVMLGAQGAYLDDIAFCPHHPDKGYPDENPKYKMSCSCRKPATGMIDAMVKKYNIDCSLSYMVGDSTIDIQTGVNAGLKTILLETGQGGQDGKFHVSPDVVEKDVKSAVEYILRSFGKLR
ncbi:MAG: HAD-IIIA family hydrolase [Lachnospiraceae bacterium]|jgi:mannose-1-phosphate guanylyltransferase/phosphomannomutase|nr:HAD-IIIA family hydrolase [Lachnospiraceae bacterium]